MGKREAAERKAAAKRAADRAEARARGDDVEYGDAATLDPALPGAEPAASLPAPRPDPGEDLKPVAIRWDDPAHPVGVAYHPSGRPVVRYGPPPTYPQGEAEDALCAAIVEHGAQGYTLHAICLKIGYPPKTVKNWATQPYGAKLAAAIAEAEEYARGALEGEARENTTNAKYNTALFGKLMSARFDEYRTVSVPLSSRSAEEGGLVKEGMSDFEFERRLVSAVERIKARSRDVETKALPAPDEKERAE